MPSIPPSDPTRTPPTRFVGGDEEVLHAALGWLGEGRGAAVATVVATWGSAPRRVGSQMAVSDGREMVGSVSGGCVEGAVVEAAQEVLDAGEPRLLEFGVTNDEAWAVGLACGGTVKIWVEALE